MNDLCTVDAAYNRINEATDTGWIVSSVFWSELESYHIALKNFEGSIKRQDLHEECSDVIRFHRRYRFLLSSTPLSPGVLANEMRKWTSNSAALQIDHFLDGFSSECYKHLKDAASRLQSKEFNPLWHAAKQDILGCWEQDAQIAVLCGEPRLAPIIQKYITPDIQLIGDCRVLGPSALKSCEIYDDLLVFGPTSRNYNDGSEFVYRSPRACSLRLYTPHFYRASIPSPYPFDGSPNGSNSTSTPTFAKPTSVIVGATAENPPRKEVYFEDEWAASLPILPDLSNFLGTSNPDTAWCGDSVQARQVLLSADHAVFFSVESGTYRVCKELNHRTGSDVCGGVEYTDVEDLSPGDIVLFQEHGGGSMIGELANDILGDRATELRLAQSLWKKSLISLVRSGTVENVTRLLRAKGASIKTSITVKNWCQPENIGPGSWRNFDILLQLLELTEQRSQIFAATHTIRAAHRSAGFKLAGKLLEMMGGKSLEDLKRKGKQEFGGVAGTPNRKVAYEILAILPEEIEIPSNQANQPFLVSRLA